MEPSKPSYNKIDSLGEGNYGKAYLVKEQNSGSLFVMKMVDIKQMDAAEKKAAK